MNIPFLQNVKCNCDLCIKIRSLGMITSGGWADPRRCYFESEEDFLERVPDGFIKWPKDHIDPEEEPAKLYYIAPKIEKCPDCESTDISVAGRCVTCYSCGASTCSL